MLLPSDIRSAVVEVLSATENSLCSYQILDRLPACLRNQIIAERGFPGAGSGHSYSAASLITDAVELVLPSLEPPYRIYIDTGRTTYHIAGRALLAGNQAIAFYRLRPPAAPVPAPTIPTVHGATPDNPIIAPRPHYAPGKQTFYSPPVIERRPWYETKRWMILALIFFWPVFLNGIWKNSRLSKNAKWTVISIFALPTLLGVFSAAFSSHDGQSSGEKNSLSGHVVVSASSPPVFAKPTPVPKRDVAAKKQEAVTVKRREEQSRNEAQAEEKSARWQERLQAEKTYVEEITELQGGLGEGFGKLNNFLHQYPAKFGDRQWHEEIMVASVGILLICKSIQEVHDVPENERRHYALLKEMSQLTSENLPKLVDGINQQDSEKLNSALPGLKKAGELMVAANEELANVKSRFLADAKMEGQSQ